MGPVDARVGAATRAVSPWVENACREHAATAIGARTEMAADRKGSRGHHRVARTNRGVRSQGRTNQDTRICSELGEQHAAEKPAARKQPIRAPLRVTQ